MPEEFVTVVDGFTFTESPRWHAGRLWFSDFYSKQVLSVNEDGSGLRTEAKLEGQPGGLGWLPDGRLLILSKLDRRVLRREHDGSLVMHADLSAAQGDLNDMLVDADGSAYVGDYGFDLFAGEPFEPGGSLQQVAPDGAVSVLAKGLWFPNDILRINNTLMVMETFASRVTAFDITPSGELVDRRTWAQWGDLPTATGLHELLNQVELACDGADMDAGGGLWVADFTHGRVVRVREGGEITDELIPGDGMVFACALGGSDGRTLFLCVTPTFDKDECVANPSSRIVKIRVDTPSIFLN